MDGEKQIKYNVKGKKGRKPNKCEELGGGGEGEPHLFEQLNELYRKL